MSRSYFVLCSFSWCRETCYLLYSNTPTLLREVFLVVFACVLFSSCINAAWPVSYDGAAQHSILRYNQHIVACPQLILTKVHLWLEWVFHTTRLQIPHSTRYQSFEINYMCLERKNGWEAECRVPWIGSYLSATQVEATSCFTLVTARSMSTFIDGCVASVEYQGQSWNNSHNCTQTNQLSKYHNYARHQDATWQQICIQKPICCHVNSRNKNCTQQTRFQSLHWI